MESIAIVQRQCTVCNQPASLQLMRQSRSVVFRLNPFYRPYWLQCNACSKVINISNALAKQIYRDWLDNSASTLTNVMMSSITKTAAVLRAREIIKERNLSDDYVRNWFKNNCGLDISASEINDYDSEKYSFVITSADIGEKESSPLNKLTTEQLMRFALEACDAPSSSP